MISYEDKMKEKELSLHSFVIAIACLVVQLLSVGSMLSVSVFYIEFMDYFRDSASSTAWINSVCIGTTFLTGPIASTLVNRFGVRSVVIVGALFITTGFILSIFAKTLTMLYFSYGLLTGIGNGFSFGPSIIYVGLSFKKYYSIANGFVACGVAISLMAFPPLYQILIDSYGWRGAFLIIAGMNSNIIVCGLLMRDGRPRLHQDKEQNNQDERLNKSQELPEQCDERCETSFALMNQETVSEIKESTSDTHTDVDTSKDFSLTENTSSRAAERNITSQTMWLHRLTRNCWVHTLGNLGFHLFHSSFFVLMWILSFFLGIAYFTAMVFLMAKVVSAGVTRLDASFLMIISGICSLVGRLLHGSMVDLAKVSPLLVYGSHVFIGGLNLILIPLGRSYAVFAVLIGIFGYSYGVYYPVSIVCLKHKLGVQNLSSALGWIFFITGIGTLIGPPVAGHLYDSFHNYNLCFYMSGTVYLCVAVAILFYYAYEKITLKTKRKAEKQDTDERE